MPLTQDDTQTSRRGGGAVGFPRTPGNSPKRRKPVYEFSFLAGENLGRDLVVTEPISAGPTTEIYRVWSESRLCSFACKVLRPSLDPAGDAARALARERRVLKRVAHPNVVRTFDLEGAPEAPHVVLEYLPGPSLLDLLASSPRRRLKIDEALRIAIRVGSALAAVHAAGYLYRDLKPANVLMRDGEPVLIDLGTAYRWRPGRAPRERVGTDPYMAPEQCLGAALSPATDVFGLGALAYELITGEWPYEEQLMNVFDRSRLHTRFPQVAYAPGSPRRKVAGVTPELERVIHRCLARRPKDRYASVADAVLELNRFLEGDARVVPDDLLPGRAA